LHLPWGDGRGAGGPAARRGGDAAGGRGRLSRGRARAARRPVAPGQGEARMAVTVRITWRRVVLALAGLAIAGLAVAWSGIINIGASTGHWAITSWFLHWSMGNTVRTWSQLTVDDSYVAGMDREHLVAAAGHFAAQCSVCHGAPGEPPSPVMRAATPPAPDLATTEGKWKDRELFWIIRHGVKYTPMPAWPAGERLDEIRGMVAFVRSLPDMTPRAYRELAYGGDAT